MSDIALFGISILFGAACAAVSFGFMFFRSTGGIAGGVILDVVFSLLFFTPLILCAALWHDGTIAAFTVWGQLLSFIAVVTPLKALYRKVQSKYVRARKARAEARAAKREQRKRLKEARLKDMPPAPRKNADKKAAEKS
ncbi:MAG: hypothetical protein HFE48_03340 [Clostridia bacterium]|nr:hypothetical protein [Clostridia bacterium]